MCKGSTESDVTLRNTLIVCSKTQTIKIADVVHIHGVGSRDVADVETGRDGGACTANVRTCNGLCIAIPIAKH